MVDPCPQPILHARRDEHGLAVVKPLHGDESGMAIVAAILVLIVVAGIITLTSVVAINSMSSSQRRSDRVAANPVVQGAITNLRIELDSGALGEVNNYTPSAATYQD